MKTVPQAPTGVVPAPSTVIHPDPITAARAAVVRQVGALALVAETLLRPEVYDALVLEAGKTDGVHGALDDWDACQALLRLCDEVRATVAALCTDHHEDAKAVRRLSRTLQSTVWKEPPRRRPRARSSGGRRRASGELRPGINRPGSPPG